MRKFVDFTKQSKYVCKISLAVFLSTLVFAFWIGIDMLFYALEVDIHLCDLGCTI